MSKIQEAIEEAAAARRQGAAGRFGAKSHLVRRASLQPQAIVDPVDLSRLARADVDFNTMAEHGIIAALDDPAATAAYKMLRTRVRQRLRDNGWRTIAISSTAAGEGKTVTAINLAVTLAKDEESTVVLADFDLRRPSLHSYLGMNPVRSLADFLQGSAELEEVLYDSGLQQGRLALLPNTRAFENSSEALSTKRVATMIQRLQIPDDGSRILLFDLPPLLSADDLLAFAPYVDTVLLVVMERKTDREALARVGELLTGTDLLGVVLNGSQEHAKGAYYSYY